MPFPKSTSAKGTDELYEAAVKALARRARSSGELRALLARKKASRKDMDAVLKRLQEHGYLDDARFARDFAAFRLRNDLQGPARVQRDLAARRVHPDLVHEAIGAAYEGVEEGELLRRHIRRKLRLTKPPEKPSALASLYRRLLRAGFRSATIVRELKRMFPGPLSQRHRMPEASSWEELLNSLAEPDESEPRQ